jgi:hypothetical protein
MTDEQPELKRSPMSHIILMLPISIADRIGIMTSRDCLISEHFRAIHGPGL